MLPVFEVNDNLLMVDCFTTRFIRNPRIGEIVITDNPFKPGATLVKRVIKCEGEMVEFYSYRDAKRQKVIVPPGHIWVEGDNKN